MKYQVSLTKADREILESYKKMVAGLSDYMGAACEIVLHSLDELDSSVIAIHNGHYSSRRVGSPVTDLALKMLEQIDANHDGDSVTYFTKTKDGIPLKSSTIVIRGTNNKAIGLLCMNFYLNAPLSMILSEFTNNAQGEKTMDEEFPDDPCALILSSVNKARETVNADHSILSANKNKEIIRILYQDGIFNLKDAVAIVAGHLNISKNTVYLHIRNFSKES